jgi:hypothetical protein
VPDGSRALRATAAEGDEGDEDDRYEEDAEPGHTGTIEPRRSDSARGALLAAARTAGLEAAPMKDDPVARRLRDIAKAATARGKRMRADSDAARERQKKLKVRMEKKK